MKGHSIPLQSVAQHRSLLIIVRVVVALGFAVALWRYPFVVAASGVLAVVLFMHELGHFVAARWTGMKVTDFYLGFGPRLWSRQRGETSYGVRILPLGAYVRIIGMSSADAVAPGDESRAYRVQSFPRRALVVSAGSLAHFVMALLAFMALHAFVGAPSYEWEVAETISERDGVQLPAAAAGIDPGDRIVAVAGTPTREWGEFVDEVKAQPGERVVLEIERGGDLVRTEVELATDPESGAGLLGVRAQGVTTYETASIPVAVLRGTGDFGRSIFDSVYGIWSLFSNLGDVADRVISPPGDASASDDLATRPLSVVGIVNIAASTSLGWPERVLLFAFVNVFLGVFNMAPLPPFDGGHLAVATYERWRERAGRARHMSDPKALAPVIAIVVTALALLAAGLLYLDIANPIDL